MAVSRRNLLQHSIFAAVAFAFGPFRAWSATTDNSPPDQGQSTITGGSLTDLDRTAFTGAVGSSFQVSPASGQGDSVWLQLMTVSDLPEITPPDPGSMAVQPPTATSPVPVTSGFMVSFLGTISPPLSQDTYTLVNGGLGTFSLLLVPEPDGQTYDAVINRVQ